MKKQKLIGGIYKIEDVKTGNVYIGSADSDTGIKKRWSHHESSMKGQYHDYREFNEAFTDDPHRIKFEILEECDDDELENRENFWIKYCSAVDGWTVINKRKKASRRGKTRCVLNMQIAQRGENNGNKKLSEQQAIEIIIHKQQKLIKQKDIAEIYNISQSQVSQIGKERWEYLA